MKKIFITLFLAFSLYFVGTASATWVSLVPDFSGIQADTVSVATSILSIAAIVVGLGILIRVMLK